jgi:hypothetical protein
MKKLKNTELQNSINSSTVHVECEITGDTSYQVLLWLFQKYLEQVSRTYSSQESQKMAIKGIAYVLGKIVR